MPQISCENLAVGYDGKSILKNINFTVNKGDYLCIIGENGSGKSTLMRTLIGLRAPVEGKVYFDNSIVPGSVGYLPQQSAVQRDFPASVKEIVLSGCQNHCGLRPFYNNEDKKTAYNIMESLDILNLVNRCYRELSGGQQQRVLLARALCSAKKILFMDEPVAGLDPKAAAEMYGLIEKFNKEYNITIVMVSHDISAVALYADYVFCTGNKMFFGTKNEYFETDTGNLLSDFTERSVKNELYM